MKSLNPYSIIIKQLYHHEITMTSPFFLVDITILVNFSRGTSTNFAAAGSLLRLQPVRTCQQAGKTDVFPMGNGASSEDKQVFPMEPSKMGEMVIKW
jgi:hypothetical protein